MISRVVISELKSIAGILKIYDQEFAPPLSSRVNIEEYVEKVFQKGEIYKYQDGEEEIKGVMFIYINDFINFSSYLSLLLVQSEFRKSNDKIGEKLLQFWIETAKDRSIKSLYLEVGADREGLVNWYEGYGFSIKEKYNRQDLASYLMQKTI